jgi:hypothetical protein
MKLRTYLLERVGRGGWKGEEDERMKKPKWLTVEYSYSEGADGRNMESGLHLNEIMIAAGEGN